MKKVFILICFAVCFFGLVSAAEYNENYTNWLLDKLEDAPNYQEFINTSGISNVITDIEQNASSMFRGECLTAYNNTAYVVGVEVSGGFGWLLSPYQNDSGYSGLSYEIGFNASNKRLQGRRMISTSNSPFSYIFAFDNNTGDILYCSKYVNNYQATSNFTLTSYDLNTSLSNSTGTKTIYWIPSEGRVNISYVYNKSTSGNYAYRIPDYNFEVSDSNMVFAPNENLNWTGYFTNEFDVTPDYTDDPNLKLNIINNEYGEKELAMDFTAFMGGSPANYISVENLVLTVDNDGTEIVYDDLDSYIEHFGTGTEQEVWAYIPLSVLVGSTAESKLVKVSFTESTSSAGGTFTEDHYISTDFWLKHEEYVTPGTITPPATIYNDVKTSTQINNIINELNQKGSEYDITTGKFSFYQTVPDFPDWADMYEFNVIFSRSGSDASYFDTWHRMNGSNYSPIDWATSTFNVRNFYENSSAWAYADVVVITVYSVIVTTDSQGFVASDYRFEGFLVWQTDRYYDHQSSFTLIDILNAFQKFANQQLENWDWLSEIFNDIQFNLFDALNEMIRNDDFVLDWLKTINVNINKGFDSVVAAISNISFPFSGGFSLDDLSDELQSLFIPQKTWDDLGYDEYKDSLGVLALPFEFTFDSLDIIKDSSNYSPNFELHVNPLSVDIPDIDGSTKNFEVFVESDISMSPTSLFPASVWNTLQYFNLFTLVVVQALITYNHIFGGEER